MGMGSGQGVRHNLIGKKHITFSPMCLISSDQGTPTVLSILPTSQVYPEFIFNSDLFGGI